VGAVDLVSASEKLKALGPPWDLAETHSWIEVEGRMLNLGSMVALNDALPEIIALVEAAEMHIQLDARYQRRLAVDHMRDALAALEARLTET
jgi:hypothetical protein